jgi:sugar/nucleoside kinase (ribokinase family)
MAAFESCAATGATGEPNAIEPVDSTGAGDSFRGAIAYGLLQGWEDEHVVDFASAVAACVCMSYPHALNAPDLDGVLAFIEQHRGRTSR